MKFDFKSLKKEIKLDLEKINDSKELKFFYDKYLGKKGTIAEIFKLIKEAKPEEKRKLGKEANLLKKSIIEIIEKKSEEVKNKEKNKKKKEERIDITRPGQKIEKGHLSPLTLVRREAEDIFQSMGFSVVEGPEMEKEWYNFDALNIPKNHPARDLWDTFWIKNSGKSKEDLLLRTHTSPMQVRYMEKHNPPFKIIVPGKCFRHEATDASHEIQFYQLEGLMVDKNISAANFRAVIEGFLKRFFKRKDIEIRLRPDYFPFTEPSFEVSVRRGKGEWMELMGAGMVHPNVFKAAGYTQSPSESGWQGFAFGAGLDRLAMVKYKIDDIRLFNSGDLRFLNQF
jgi:phenylalanyl-tRNA synthetase alpha chain